MPYSVQFTLHFILHCTVYSLMCTVECSFSLTVHVTEYHLPCTVQCTFPPVMHRFPFYRLHNKFARYCTDYRVQISLYLSVFSCHCTIQCTECPNHGVTSRVQTLRSAISATRCPPLVISCPPPQAPVTMAGPSMMLALLPAVITAQPFIFSSCG